MFFYWVAVLVLILKENADAETATTPLKPDDHPLNKSELARLINIMRQGSTRHYDEKDNEEKDIGKNLESDETDSVESESDDSFYEKFDNDKSPLNHVNLRSGADLTKDLVADKNIVQSYGIANPLDLDYFDIKLRDSLKERDNLKPSKKDLLNLLNERSQRQSKSPKDNFVRLQYIKNPGVLEQYRKNLLDRRQVSTSSSSEDSNDSSDLYELETDRIHRRNAVFRLGRPSEQSLQENPKFALRNNNDRDDRQNPRAYDNEEKDKIIVTFKETNDYNDRTRNDDRKNRNKEYESAKKDDWDAIAKTGKKDNFWNDKNNDNYKKNDYYKKDERYKNNDNNKNGDNNNRNDNYKKDDRYKNDDRYKSEDNKNDNYKKKDYGDKKKYNEDYDNKTWKKKESNSKAETKNNWDKPAKSENSWDNWKPKSEERGWNKPKKATKGIASFEKEHKNDYNDKELKKDIKTTGEWDRAVASRSSASNPKPNPSYLAKISEYYHPRPRIHESRERGGSFKAFGRTSIPFVGKKGIYEDK